ncbi:MAG: hypothetical protein VXZ58_01590, partial [Actinomycetota bacterium]|nr:hypothetical protein [Actinomycetota bacterium]
CSIKELRSPHSPTDLSSQMGLQSMSTTANNENAGPLNEPFAGMPSAENRLRTAAECLEIAEYLYHASSQLGQGKEMSYVIGRNRYMSLLLAACARLDADSLDESAEQARRQSIKMDLEECYAPYESKSAPETGVDDAANNKDEQGGGLSRLKAVENVALNSLLKANDDVDKADELLQRNLGFEDDDSLMIRKTVLIVKFTLLCRVGTPLRDANETNGFNEIKSLHNSSSEPKKVGSKSALKEFVVNRERDFLQLSAEELKRCADIACSEPEGTTEVARKLLQLAWQAHNRHSNGTSNPSDNASESVPGKEDRSLMGNIFCQMIELSDSREDALGLSQEFYQLVRNDTISTSTCLPNTEGGRYSCPYTQESIDQVTAVAYNYGVTLAELNQKALAEQFINTAIGLMQYASEEIRQWSRRVEDTYLQVLSASAHTASQAKAYSTATLKEGIASVEEGASSEPLGESLEPGIVNLFDYKAAGLAPALEAVTGATNNGDQGNSKTGNNDVTE